MSDDVSKSINTAMIPGTDVTPATAVDVKPVDVGRNDIENGLRFLHWTTVRSQEIDYDHELTIYGLAELLVAKGVISLDELREWRSRVKERVDQENLAEPRINIGPDVDKYSPAVEYADIDCGARIAHCRAACCRLSFPLSKQDLDEGVVRWEYRQPYTIKQRKDGWCVHNACENHGCKVHKQRPVVCRSYSCRNDARIWVDFEKMIPHPSLAELGSPSIED